MPYIISTLFFFFFLAFILLANSYLIIHIHCIIIAFKKPLATSFFSWMGWVIPLFILTNSWAYLYHFPFFFFAWFVYTLSGSRMQMKPIVVYLLHPPSAGSQPRPPPPLYSALPPGAEPIFKFSSHALNVCAPQILGPPGIPLTFRYHEPGERVVDP